MKNAYFNQTEHWNEQQLLHNLVRESIEIMGRSMYYLPRIRNNPDKLYGADDSSSFETAYSVPIYVTSYEGFQGDQVFLSKFGLEIRDRIILVISRDTFNDDIGSVETLDRPREGDLIYYPENKKCFEIKFVDYLPAFYPLGTLPSYRMVCELYAYSNETFKTGIDEIDSIQTNLSLDILTYALRDETGAVLVNESNLPLVTEAYDIQAIDPLADTDEIQTVGNDLLDFSETNPFNDNLTY